MSLSVEVNSWKASLQEIGTCSYVAAFQASQAQGTSGLEATELRGTSHGYGASSPTGTTQEQSRHAAAFTHQIKLLACNYINAYFIVLP